MQACRTGTGRSSTCRQAGSKAHHVTARSRWALEHPRALPAQPECTACLCCDLHGAQTDLACIQRHATPACPLPGCRSLWRRGCRSRASPWARRTSNLWPSAGAGRTRQCTPAYAPPALRSDLALPKPRLIARQPQPDPNKGSSLPMILLAMIQHQLQLGMLFVYSLFCRRFDCSRVGRAPRLISCVTWTCARVPQRDMCRRVVYSSGGQQTGKSRHGGAGMRTGYQTALSFCPTHNQTSSINLTWPACAQSLRLQQPSRQQRAARTLAGGRSRRWARLHQGRGRAPAQRLPTCDKECHRAAKHAIAVAT